MVTTVKNGQQNIQGLMPDGSLIPINLSVQDGKPVIEDGLLDLDFKVAREPEEKPVSGLVLFLMEYFKTHVTCISKKRQVFVINPKV